MGFTQNHTLSVGTTPVRIMLARQAAYPLWFDQTIAGRGYYTTFGLIPMQSTGVVTAGNEELDCDITNTLAYWVANNISPSAAVLGLQGLTSAISYPYIGVDSGCGPRPFTYIPQGYTGTWAVTFASPVSGVVQVKVQITEEIWSGPGASSITFGTRSVVVSSGVCGGTASFSASTNMWVRPSKVTVIALAGGTINLVSPQVHLVATAATISYTSSAGDRGVVQCTPYVVTATMPAGPPAEFGTSALPWSSTRTTAAAALYTNVTQVLNKGGTVLAARVSPHNQNPFNVSTNYIATLHPAERAYLPLETGHYTYCPPSTDLVNFWDYSLDTSIGSQPAPLYRLDNDSLINIAFFTNPGVTESMAITLDWHIEFRTTSALFQVGLSALTLESFHQAQLALTQVGFFFPNNTHKSLIGRVMSTAAHWAKSLYPVVESMVPQANMALKVGKGIHDLVFTNRPQKSIAPTSASSAGIVKKSSPPRPKPKAKKAKVKRASKR
jgi:hypothetical protein